jgi:WD40 repeat protein
MNDIRIDRNFARLGVGVVAGIALLVLIISLVVTPGFSTVGYVALGVAIAAVAGFIFLDPQSVLEAITGRTGQYVLSTAILSAIFVALIVALFVVIREANLTPIDTTEASRFRLSDESRQIVNNLDEPIEAIAFYAGADINGREEAELWLNAYEAASGGNFTWRFVDPEREPGLAQNLGVESNGTIVFQQGDRTAEVTFLNERNLTNAFVRVLIGEDRVVYSLVGHGERDIFAFEGQQYSNIRQSLERVGFVFNALNLLEEEGIPEDADLVMILAPQSQFAPSEIEALQAYVADGGSLLLLSEPNLGTGDALSAGILAVDFAPNGRTFATAGSDGTIKVWDTNNATEQVVISGHNNIVYGVDFSPDGSQLASMSRDGTVRVWDADSGEQITELEGHTANSGAIAFSPDGSYLASVSGDQLLRMWDANTFEPLPYSPIPVNLQMFDLAFNDESDLLAVAGGRANAAGTAAEGLLYLWDPATGDELTNAVLHQDFAFGVAFNPNGETIHTVAVDGTEGIYNVADEAGESVTPFEETIPMVDLDFGSDGQAVYTLADNTVRVLEEGEETLILEGHTDIVWDTEIRANDIVTVSADGDIRLWSASTGEQDELITQAHAAANLLADYLQTDWGLTLRDDFVIDVGSANFTRDLSLLRITNFGSSPVVEGLQTTPPLLLSARSITTENVGSVRTVNLLQTSGTNSWGETTDPFLAQPELDPEQDIPGPVTVGVTSENTGTGARMVVIGDADFASNDLLTEYRAFGNDELMVNAVNWLTESDQLIDLPSPEFDQATIDQPLQPIALQVTSIALICLLPGAVMLVGIVTWISRRRRR